MEGLQVFENAQFGQVRIIEENGKPLFCGSDVAKALGYMRPADALAQHCKGSVKRRLLTAGGEQDAKFIPEGDVYRLIARSKLPAAERFEKWVFDEVLPSIRKNGGYIVGQETMTDDELLANALMVAQRKIAARDKQIEVQEKQIEAMHPKALFADAVSASKTSILIGDLAKLLKQNGVDIGQKRLFQWLRENKYLISQKGASYNSPTQRSMEMKLFEVKETTITHADGHITINRTAKVTGKGQVYFINKFVGNAKS